jgi:hypothetical protein
MTEVSTCPHNTADRAIGPDWNGSNMPGDVLEESTGRVGDPRCHGDQQNARQQIVDVLHSPGVDRPSEYSNASGAINTDDCEKDVLECRLLLVVLDPVLAGEAP